MFQLLFSDPTRTFYSSGDKLSGWVQLEAGSPCRLTGLRVTAAGCARVESRSRRQEVEYLKYEEEVRLEEVLSTAQIDRKGFCEGEDININAKFENTCSRIVVPKAAIIAKHSYIINSHTKVNARRFLTYCPFRARLLVSTLGSSTGSASETDGGSRKPYHLRHV
ncbi:hypothetical protein XENOCAPTIV_002841 [Xenoophorus captivus]|uniref:Arrestin C-terminal-like domain-containing protein n=1 Tax=Xenoophorus captivus TaxID=1517983 RepID=A0ABV0Q8L4_9TELE